MRDVLIRYSCGLVHFESGGVFGNAFELFPFEDVGSTVEYPWIDTLSLGVISPLLSGEKFSD